MAVLPRGAALLVLLIAEVTRLSNSAHLRPPVRFHSARMPRSLVRCAAGSPEFSDVVDELMRASDDELLQVMQRNIQALLSPGFIGTLRRVGRQGVTEGQREAAKRLEFSVVVFLEELIEQVQELERAEASGDAGGAPLPSPIAESVPRRADGSNALATRPLRPRAPKPPPTPAQAAVQKAQSAEELQMDHRARLEALLMAASKDAQSLEEALQQMAASQQLDGPFLAHLKWEMNEQVARGNARLLHILQLVVQRACLVAESTLAEAGVAAHHLSTLLQIHDREARRSYWQGVVAKLAVNDQQQLVKVVCNVCADVGQRVQNGMEVDDALLRQIRVVRDELDEHLL
jgi:hypothetical protein